MDEFQNYLGCVLVQNINASPDFVLEFPGTEKGHLILMVSFKLPIIEEVLNFQIWITFFWVKEHWSIFAHFWNRMELISQD